MMMMNYLALIKTDILRQFLKKCKFDINGWNTTAEIGIDNSTEKTITATLFLTESLNF